MGRRAFGIGGPGALIAAVLGLAAGPMCARAQSPRPVPDAGAGALPPAAIAGLGDAAPYAPMEFSRAWLAKVAQVRQRRAELAAAGRKHLTGPEMLGIFSLRVEPGCSTGVSALQ